MFKLEHFSCVWTWTGTTPWFSWASLPTAGPGTARPPSPGTRTPENDSLSQGLPGGSASLEDPDSLRSHRSRKKPHSSRAAPHCVRTRGTSGLPRKEAARAVEKLYIHEHSSGSYKTHGFHPLTCGDGDTRPGEKDRKLRTTQTDSWESRQAAGTQCETAEASAQLGATPGKRLPHATPQK